MLADDACSQLIHSLVTVRIATPCCMVCLILPFFDCKRFCKVVFPKMELLLVFSKNPKMLTLLSLEDLHWLPIRQAITFKIDLFKAHGAYFKKYIYIG